MNRREQIEKAARCHTLSTIAPDNECDIVYAQFIAGATWADKNPVEFKLTFQENELLREQLSVAMEALDTIANDYSLDKTDMEIAEEALEKIKGMGKIKMSE